MKLILILAVYWTVPASIQAIKCYECGYTDHPNFENTKYTDIGCKNAEEKFLVECKAETIFPGINPVTSQNITKEVEITTSTPRSRELEQYSCGEAFATNIEKGYEGILRGCVNSKQDQCGDNLMDPIFPGITFKGCICNTDKCNKNGAGKTTSSFSFFYVLIILPILSKM